MRLVPTTWRWVGVDDYVLDPTGEIAARVVDERDGWLLVRAVDDSGMEDSFRRPAPDEPVTVMVPDEADAAGVVTSILGARPA